MSGRLVFIDWTVLHLLFIVFCVKERQVAHIRMVQKRFGTKSFVLRFLFLPKLLLK